MASLRGCSIASSNCRCETGVISTDSPRVRAPTRAAGRGASAITRARGCTLPSFARTSRHERDPKPTADTTTSAQSTKSQGRSFMKGAPGRRRALGTGAPRHLVAVFVQRSPQHCAFGPVRCFEQNPCARNGSSSPIARIRGSDRLPTSELLPDGSCPSGPRRALQGKSGPWRRRRGRGFGPRTGPKPSWLLAAAGGWPSTPRTKPWEPVTVGAGARSAS